MKTIPQREMRNHSGDILRQAEAGEHFAITVDGRPVAVLGPFQKRQWVSRADVLKIVRSHTTDSTLIEEVAELGGTLEGLGDPWKM